MIVTITFMFGAGIPILFPIGLVALLIEYWVERFAMAYYYRMPPNFDDDLNYIMISNLLWAPLIYAGIGFWMYTNCQMFDNIVIPIEYIDHIVLSGHTIGNSITNIKPGWPFLILFLVMILFRIMEYFGWEKYIQSSEIKDFMNLKSKKEEFVNIISSSDKKWFLSENNFLKH
jgi:hypothetical protein